MNVPIITGIAAGLLYVLQQALMLTVGMRRIVTKRGAGFGDDVNLERLIRNPSAAANAR